MVDVFISYAHGDREWVRAFAAALEAEGFSTWWDPDLLPGNRYREAIAQALQSSPAVIVVWSSAALASDWVRDEAEDARQARKLIPILREYVAPPHGFRQVQTADLSDWQGKRQHPEFRRVVEALKELRGARGDSVPVAQRASTLLPVDPPVRHETISATQRRYALRFAWRWLLPSLVLVYAALLYLIKEKACGGRCPSSFSSDAIFAPALIIVGHALLRLCQFLARLAQRQPVEGSARYAAWTAMAVVFLAGTASFGLGLYGLAYMTEHDYPASYEPPEDSTPAIPAPAASP